MGNGNMGSPRVIDLYSGLQSHGILKVCVLGSYLQTKETGKSCTHDRGPGKVMQIQSSLNNTVRDHFTDTATPHFFNVAIRCIHYSFD